MNLKRHIMEDVPPDFLRAIGRVAVSWSRLEMMVDTAVAAILGVEADAHAAMTAGLTFQARIDMLTGLKDTLREGKRKSDLAAVINAIRQKQADRNFIIHAVWIDGGRDVQGHLLKRGPKTDRVELWTVTDIEEVANKINSIQSQLIEWIERRRTPRSDRRVVAPAMANKGSAAARRLPRRSPTAKGGRVD